MRWCRFESEGRISFGIVEGDSIIEVDGDPLYEHSITDRRLKIADINLLVPLIPRTFYAAGINYRDHVIKMAAITGREVQLPQSADIGYRAHNALIAHGQPIILPRDATEKTQYEGELVVVIGKRAKHIKKEEALDYVFGFTIGNDFSERTWQAGDRGLWRAKNSDTFKPMGPWIETDADLEKMQTIIRVNGNEQDNFKTNNMIFDIPTYMSRMSDYMALEPGDVIWMGTDGVPENVTAGDTVEIEITGIGTLRNSIEKEE